MLNSPAAADDLSQPAAQEWLAPAATACTVEDHEVLKADPARVAAETTLHRVWHDEEEGTHLELRNCRRCESTLAVVLPGHRDVEVGR